MIDGFITVLLYYDCISHVEKPCDNPVKLVTSCLLLFQSPWNKQCEPNLSTVCDLLQYFSWFVATCAF